MKAPEESVLKKALALHQKGAKMKEILEETGLNYSQAWLYITDAELPQSQRVSQANRTPATVRKLREEGDSWGLISVKFGYLEFSESKIRSMYQEFTGKRSQGLRIGRGGRWYGDEPRLYNGVRRRSGVRIAKGVTKGHVLSVAPTLPDDVAEITEDGVKKTPGGTRAAAKATGVVKAGRAKKATKTTKTVRKAKAAATTNKDPFE